MNRITILLAEDHTVVREGFRRMLDFERDFELVGEAQHGRQAVAMVARLRPEVVLMDIAMPQLNGLEATRQILKRFPGTRVVMLSAHNDDAYVESAIEAGAKGFLLKQASFREICDAIRKVRDGGRFYAPGFSSDWIALSNSRPRGRARPREDTRADVARDGSSPDDRRGQGQQGDGGGIKHCHENGGEASRAPHEKAGYP